MVSCAAVANRRRPIDNRPQLNKLPHGLRSFLVDDYLIIHHVVHGSRDIAGLMLKRVSVRPGHRHSDAVSFCLD
jgi:hypothetical protein